MRSVLALLFLFLLLLLIFTHSLRALGTPFSVSIRPHPHQNVSTGKEQSVPLQNPRVYEIKKRGREEKNGGEKFSPKKELPSQPLPTSSLHSLSCFRASPLLSPLLSTSSPLQTLTRQCRSLFPRARPSPAPPPLPARPPPLPRGRCSRPARRFGGFRFIFFLLFSFFFSIANCAADASSKSLCPMSTAWFLMFQKGWLGVCSARSAVCARGERWVSGTVVISNPVDIRREKERKLLIWLSRPPPDTPLLGHLAHLSPSRPLRRCRQELLERSGD